MARPSAIIIPFRTEPRFEIFWSVRQPHLKFLGGYHAFLGGGVEPEDHLLPIFGEQPDPWIACACRELLEETSVWVGVHGPRWMPELRELPPAIFLEALLSAGESIDANRFRRVGHWITPEHSAIRHESHFFAVDLTDLEGSDDLASRVQVSEISRGEWVTPHSALQQWSTANAFITSPIRFLLQAFDVAGNVAVFVDGQSVRGAKEHAESAPGVYVVPLRTPTLAPATHTNAVLIGEAKFVVIDPGSPEVEQQELLNQVIDEHIEAGGRFEAIVLTHHHQDHVLGIDALMDRYKVGLWAHPKTGVHLDRPLERELRDGDRIDLGLDSLDVIFTPGHADGHLAFHHRKTNIVVVGDLVAQHGTILVDPSDGHMGDYLDSLQTIAELNARALLPAHGWLIVDPAAHLRFYREHRLQREEKVFAALATFACASAYQVTELAYDDVPEYLWPIAERSVISHLIHLAETGRVFQHGEMFEVRPDGHV